MTFGIRYSSGTIRPNNWYPNLNNCMVEHFMKRNNKTEMLAVPKDYINRPETIS